MAALDPFLLVLIVGGAFGVLALGLLLQINAANESKRIKNRLERTRGNRGSGNRPSAALSVRLKQGNKQFAAIDELAKRFIPHPVQLRTRLTQTGYDLSIGQVVVIGAIAGLAVTTLMWMFVSPRGLVLLLIFVVVSMTLPHFMINLLIKRREKNFLKEFPESLDLIIRGLKSGLPVPESIRVVGQEFDGPVGQEFRIVSDKIKLGQSLEEALWDATNRVAIQDFKFFVISLAVQRETGGNLAETLENLTDILRRRRQMKLKIKAMSSEAKASAIILGSLPFIMFGILLLLNRDYTSLLYTDPRGMVMMGIGIGFITTGAFVLKKMVSFEI